MPHIFDTLLYIWSIMLHVFGTMPHFFGTMPHIFGTNLNIFCTMPHFFGTMLHKTLKYSLVEVWTFHLIFSQSSLLIPVFDRPCVAEAVLQTALSLIH